MKYQALESDRYVIRLDKDEKIHATLAELFGELQVQGGFLTGIGAVKNVEVGFYHLERKSYERKLFTEHHELLSLTGNVSFLNDERVIHTHVTFSNAQFECFGGHLFEAEVAVTAEIFFQKIPIPLYRKPNTSIGLNLLELPKARFV